MTGLFLLASTSLSFGVPSVSAGLAFHEALARVSREGRAVLVARRSAAMAHEDVGRARSPLLPQVSANAGRQHYVYQPASVLGGSKIFTAQKDFNFAGLGVYQTLYDFGASGSGLKAARVGEEAVSDEIRRVQNQAALEFIGAYFDLLETDRLVAVARDTVSSLASHLKDVTILWREGVSMKNDLLTVRVKFSAARQNLVALKNVRLAGLTRIKALLALDDKTPLLLDDPEIAQMQPSLKEAQAMAAANRPELQLLEKAARASEFREEAARSGDKPVLFANGGYNYAQNRYQARDDNWALSLGVRFNIFDGGLTKAETAREKAQHEQILEQRRKATDDIRSEVEKAYRDLDTATSQISASRTAIRQAEENLRVNRVRYKEGAGTSTEVLDALTLLSGTKTDLWKSVYERKRARARLLYTMGRDIGEEYIK
ncbi:MAG: TolC family protein [Candidatus Omnitrophica bacterium]|nr:TolC family protein [Candidatus Omnitrophota bacterium]